MSRLWPPPSKAPLAVAGLLAAPLFFAALMCSSLAYDRPEVSGRTEHPPSTKTEATIWALALIPPAIVLLAGILALPLRRYGLHVAAIAGIVVALLLPVRLDTWVARHEQRFPEGIDLVWDGSSSNASSKGEWEHSAKITVLGLTHWTIAIAVAAMVVAGIVEVRRRRGAEPLVVGTSPLEQTGGAPPQV